MKKDFEIHFTRHASEKLSDSTSKKLGINFDLIKNVLNSPELIDSSEFPILMAVKELNKTLSLCVIYKLVEKSVRVITFFPARRGRYESKILS